MDAKNIDSPNWTLAQLMVTAAAREIADREVVFVGMRLPLLGFLLAKSTHATQAVGVYELGIVRDTLAPEPILTMGDLPNLVHDDIDQETVLYRNRRKTHSF